MSIWPWMPDSSNISQHCPVHDAPYNQTWPQVVEPQVQPWGRHHDLRTLWALSQWLGCKFDAKMKHWLQKKKKEKDSTSKAKVFTFIGSQVQHQTTYTWDRKVHQPYFGWQFKSKTHVSQFLLILLSNVANTQRICICNYTANKPPLSLPPSPPPLPPLSTPAHTHTVIIVVSPAHCRWMQVHEQDEQWMYFCPHHPSLTEQLSCVSQVIVSVLSQQ